MKLGGTLAPRVAALAATLLLASGATRTEGVVLFSEDFEGLPLGPTVSPTEVFGQAVWTDVPPAGWYRDNTTTPAGPPAEFFGWTFVNRDWWIATAVDQARSSFTKGEGTIAVADPDEYDDGTDVDPTGFNVVLVSPVIPLGVIPPSSVTVSFDSSWRYEDSQEGLLDVSYDGGGTFFEVRRFLPSDPVPDTAYIDEHSSFPLANPGGGSLILRWWVRNAGNDWWWAIDNLEVTAAAPEPARWVLLATGAVSLGCCLGLRRLRGPAGRRAAESGAPRPR
jgi:hypothetical protein